MQYTIVDDDVEAAPIYRFDCKASQPARPHKNHGLCIEHIPTWKESQCKQQMQSLVVPCTVIISKYFQNPGNTEMHITSVVRLGFAPHTVPYGLMIKVTL